MEAERTIDPADLGETRWSRWLRHAQLAFLAFYFVRFLFPPIAWWEYVVNGLGLVAFLFFYVQASRHMCDGALWPIAGMALTGAVMAPFNSGANAFFIFSAYFMGRSRPARDAWLGIVALLIFVALLALFVNPSWNFWLPAIVVIIGVGGLAMRDRRDAIIRAELAQSRDEVRRLAGEAERERIARDLHDVLGHTLSLVTIKTELAGKLMRQDPAAAKREIDEIEQVARKALADVRETMQGFHEVDLDAEIESLTTALDSAGVAVEIDMDRPDMDGPMQTAIALVLRESVTNVIRHSGASNCRIGLRRSPQGIVVSVSDDGQTNGVVEGNGIRGMRARVTELGGSLSISNGRGTEVVARFPSDT